MQKRGPPSYPAKGQRRHLDEAWLDLIHSNGLAQHLPEVPGPPPALAQATNEFNQGQYWQCHETLEVLWLPERYPLKLFYHALIKAAVGLLHEERHNHHGALVKLADAQNTLAPFLPQFMGIDTTALYQDIKERLPYLKRHTVVDWADLEKLPPVQIRLTTHPYSQPGG